MIPSGEDHKATSADSTRPATPAPVPTQSPRPEAPNADAVSPRSPKAEHWPGPVATGAAAETAVAAAAGLATPAAAGPGARGAPAEPAAAAAAGLVGVGAASGAAAGPSGGRAIPPRAAEVPAERMRELLTCPITQARDPENFFGMAGYGKVLCEGSGVLWLDGWIQHWFAY